jgi:hypothetical protein
MTDSDAKPPIQLMTFLLLCHELSAALLIDRADSTEDVELGSLAGRHLPLRQRRRAPLPANFSVDEVSLEVQVVVAAGS